MLPLTLHQGHAVDSNFKYVEQRRKNNNEDGRQIMMEAGGLNNYDHTFTVICPHGKRIIKPESEKLKLSVCVCPHFFF